MTTEEAKKVGIKEFLARLGITPARSNDRSGMYLSPLRDEHTPSFCVNYVRNV